MNTYIWPAHVEMTEQCVLLVFPEWPDLAPGGDTVQEAMIAAVDALSAAVAARIEATRTIPAPSDVGPRQIPIAINAETAARVDAYLEEREARKFRQQTEIQQAARERRGAFLTEFRANLEPIERTIDRVNVGATEFALTGIRSCYFLNAGGLIAIPAIMKILPETALPGSELLWPAGIFVLAGISQMVPPKHQKRLAQTNFD